MRIKQRQDSRQQACNLIKMNQSPTFTASTSRVSRRARLEKTPSAATCKRVVKSSDNAHHTKHQVLDNKKKQRGHRHADSRDTSRRTRSTAATYTDSPRCPRRRLVREPKGKRHHGSYTSLRESVDQHEYEEGGGGGGGGQYMIHIDDDDVSTSSGITLGHAFGGDEDYYASGVFLTCPAVPNYVPHSWTIRVLDHEKAADTLWFRIFYNGQRYDYLDLEDTEILSFVKSAIQKFDGTFSFYVETDNGQVVFAESNLILDILRLLLEQAKTHDTIHIPTVYQQDHTAGESAEVPKKQKTFCWPFSPIRVAPITQACEWGSMEI
jgi:hypothetical protein